MDRGEYEVNTSHSSCLPLSVSVPVRYFRGNLHFAFFFRHSFRVWGVKQKLNNQSKKKKKEQDRKNCANHCASTRCFTKATVAQFEFWFVHT